MLFLQKWALNVSKFILFLKWTAISKLSINFYFFTNIYISEMFYRYLKTAKCANMLNGNKRNSKMKGRMTMKIGI